MISPQPIHVAFDAKRMFLNYSGLGNYSRTLFKNLLQHQSGFHYHLLTPETGQNEQMNFLKQHLSGVDIHTPKSFKTFGAFSLLLPCLQKTRCASFTG
jgi:hypothetical protein